MSQQPIWITEDGSLGIIPEGEFYKIEVRAYDPDFPNNPGKITYSLLAGELPAGVQVQKNGSVEGIPISIADVKGVPTAVNENITSKFTIRATSDDLRINDRTFTLTITGQDVPKFLTPAGSLGTFIDGQLINIQLDIEDDDPNDTLEVTVVAGMLPIGTTINLDGLISGHIVTTALAAFDYDFTVQVTDGKNIDVRNYSMTVQDTGGPYNPFLVDPLTFDPRVELGILETDYEYSITPSDNPINIGRFKHDNYFAFQLFGMNSQSEAFTFAITAGSLPPAHADLPMSQNEVVLDADTGWIHGYLPDIGLTETSYSFSVTLTNTTLSNELSIVYNFEMSAYGNIDTEITWITPQDLGTISNGAISTIVIEAEHETKELFYKLDLTAVNEVPDSLSVQVTGELAGEVSFETFSLDDGTTTFDKERSTRLDTQETYFDASYVFTVEAYSLDGIVSVTREFTLLVIREFTRPYFSMYATARPPREDLVVIRSIVDSPILDPALIFRPNDVNFGTASDVTYEHIFGLSEASLWAFTKAFRQNHYRKTVVLGPLKTARALDSNNNLLYEVVYSEIQDDQVNTAGRSISQEMIVVDSVINQGIGQQAVQTAVTVYPNSLENMRERTVTEVGQESRVLPLWMHSEQIDGSILGFTHAWVIAYTKPEQGELVRFRLDQAFGEQLNEIDFEIDRFSVDYKLQIVLPEDCIITIDSTTVSVDDSLLLDGSTCPSECFEVTVDTIVDTADEGFLIDDVACFDVVPVIAEDEVLGCTTFADSDTITADLDVITSDILCQPNYPTNVNHSYIFFPQIEIIDKVPIS